MMDSDSDNDDFHSACSDSDSFVSAASLADKLDSQFSDVPRNFNVVHVNTQSIPAHFPDMLATFNNKNIHAILVSESWFKPCHPSISYSLPGFQLIRNDRIPRRGGGVAIYLRSYITYTILSVSPQPPPSDAGEHLFLEVELSHTKVLLGVYYCPSSGINYFSSFESLLQSLIPSYSQTIILGDLNTCLLKKDSRSSSLQAISESLNLPILQLNSTHHVPGCIPSLLDLIFVSSQERVVKHGQFSADNFSYHDLLFLSYKIRPPKARPRTLMQRSFGAMDLDRLRDDARAVDWALLYTANTVDEQVDIFNSKLIQLYDVHAPIRAIKVRHMPSPWLTDEIKAVMKRKAAAKSRYKTKPTELNKDKYVAIRNQCNKMCRNAQRQHIHSSVQNGDPAKVWKFLRSLGVGKQRQEFNSKDLDLNSLNRHFSSSSNFNRTTKTNTLNYLSSLPTPDYSPFFFDQFAACDVKKSIQSITSNAVGNDCISRNMILPILDELLPVICHILNSSIINGTFPSAWKEAQITPLPKKPKPSSFVDYRPISILPFLSKVLERLIHNQLNAFLCRNNLLNPYQSGFRPGHSTTTALINIADDIRSGMEDGNLTVLCLLDFSNAFNTVDFDILLAILGSLNISPTAIDWFRGYLFGRRQRIKLDNVFSSWCTTSAGVPQGGVLSPLLFSIFINTISNDLISSYHLYADDLQIYCQIPSDNLSQGILTINKDLDSICAWTGVYGLQINPTKTQAIVIGSSYYISRVNWATLPQVCFNGVTIPISDKVKNLGIYFDQTLSWNAQLQNVSRKIFASAGYLRRLRNFLPTDTKTVLVQSILLPILDYADVSYLDLNEDQLDKLDRLQNICIRFIFGLRKFDHVSEFRTRLRWLPIRRRRDTHILSLLYNTLFNPSSPNYLKKRFSYLHDTHTRYLRSSENLKLCMPRHSTRFFDKSFTIEAVRLWNALPETIRRAQTLQTFKTLVKEHYLSL